MTSHEAVRVRGLTKRYPARRGAADVVAVDGLDLDVHHGEVFALLGPTGAGKTTIVGVLTGDRDRTAGSVDVLGTDPRAPTPEWRSRLGLVPQGTVEFGAGTVRDIVRNAARSCVRCRDVDEVVSAAGLEELVRRRASRLSHGQRRRLDLALGIISAPDLLVLDDPTSGIDDASRQGIWRLIASLNRAGTTVVLTTPDAHEAAALGDRAGIIVGGRLVDLAAPHALGPPSSRTAIVRWRDSSGRRQEQRSAEPGRFVRALTEGGFEPPELVIERPGLVARYPDLVAVSTGAALSRPTPDARSSASTWDSR